jgi:orotidine-5'-phosphate decarboxylase
MSQNFADRLIEKIIEKKTPICVGLDPRLNMLPASVVKKALKNDDNSPFKQAAEAILEFNKGIIDAVCDLVAVVKPQIAFYEIFGADGVWAYQETIKYAKSKGLIVVADIKRGDIGSTATAYAQAFLGEVSMFEDSENEIVSPIFGADSVTVNAYMGYDSVQPFVDEAAKYNGGAFVLVKTSNKYGGDLQDIVSNEGPTVHELMGHYVNSWGFDHIGKHGYSLLGAVVGATYPAEAKKLRELMPNALFLVPGYGAQGAGAEEVKPCFDKNGLGAIINSSRGINFAYKRFEMPETAYADAARKAVLEMKKDLQSVCAL